MARTEYTMKRRALSNICTGLGTLGVYLLTQNWLVTALMVVVLAFFFIVLFTKNGFTKKFTVLFAVLVIILIALMCYFRFKPDDTPKEDNTPTISDVQDEVIEDPTDDQEVIIDDTTEDTTSNRKNWSYSTLPDKEIPTYSNTKDIESNKPNEYGGTGNSKVEGSTTVKVNGESQTGNKETQAADEAEKRGDNMENLNEGVIAGTKDPVKEETKPPVVKDEATKQDPNDNKVEEVESAESKGEVAPPPSTDEQIPLEEQVKEDLTDKELEDLVNTTPKEEPKEDVKQDEVNSQPEHNQSQDDDASKEQPKQPEKDNKEEDATEEVKPEEVEKNENETQVQPEVEEDVEEKNDSNDVTEQVPVEEEKEEVKEEVVQPTLVTITPLDGDQAYAGDSVQFKLTGDVGSVTGLDGLQYSMANGYLTVETNPNEATVLTITVVGTDGVSTATTSVTINVINVQ